jgi:uncharacterized protein YndB with AHSA1/START domain
VSDPDEVRTSIRLPVAPERGFEAFVDLNSWWPREYTWSGEALERIELEARQGGACVEWGLDGFRCDWGRVIAWEPPERLAFRWQISPRREPVPDPAEASEVEVSFEPTDGGTEVTLVHRGFDRHGEGAGEYRQALASEQGWPYILGRLEAALS